ncbi:FUSC family protein [Micromonospora craniellae]|uniref:Aromatic acid exporter family protein n=1 Tax=Micromonospora craniellae TaxID=2294034 RepID=A0A372FTJ7_9ACTN|nr:FUSC family protein [Micromonospora craniellae]QOC94968.1 FUSC family protein [Micromonospora craniellae]RFS44053.1 aromatic acid exporter family protein [Micromonospora craniellae]
MRISVDSLRGHASTAGQSSFRRVRQYLLLAFQGGLAATLAFVIAGQVLGNPEPTFAPAAAVGVIAASIGRRAIRAAELILGVLLGIFVGDLLVDTVGTGPWQTFVIVFGALLAAVAVRGTGGLVTQAGGTAVLIATLAPNSPDVLLPRTVNALVGGATGLVVVLLLAPMNPIRSLRRVAGPALDTFARQMTTAAERLARGDGRGVERLLNDMRHSETQLRQVHEVVTAAAEVVRFSPLYWRRRRALSAYRAGAGHLDRAFRNSRTLVRRIHTTLRDQEPVPADLPAAIEHFGQAVRLLHQEFLARQEPQRARERVLRAVREAGVACRQEMGFSGTIVVSQLRTVANDLLRATGVPGDEARRLVRHAAAGM